MLILGGMSHVLWFRTGQTNIQEYWDHHIFNHSYNYHNLTV